MQKIWLVISAIGVVLELFFKAIVVTLTMYGLSVLVEVTKVQMTLIAIGGLYWIITTFIGKAQTISSNNDTKNKQSTSKSRKKSRK